jgi:hypothetical protein
MASTGGAVAAVSTSGQSAASNTELWAVISSSGQILSGRGVTSASQPFGTGTYQVLFNRNVVKCAYAVTTRSPSSIVFAEPRNHHKNGVYVQIENPSTSSDQNATFSLQVEC